MAYIAIRSQRVQSHKEWVIRSYVLTFSFVNFRWLIDLPLIATVGTPTERLVTVVWLGLTFPLIVTEFFLQWKHVRRT